jgi:hypothetical protein
MTGGSVEEFEGAVEVLDSSVWVKVQKLPEPNPHQGVESVIARCLPGLPHRSHMPARLNITRHDSDNLDDRVGVAIFKRP